MVRQALVTGAGGFTGAALANRLARSGYRVRALVRRGSSSQSLDPELVDGGQIELVWGDLREDEVVDHAVAGTDYVFHLAALFRSALPRQRDFWDTNVGGTGRLLRAARRHEVVRFVHCSTIGVHGGVTEIPANEDSAFAPGDIYQRTKLEGERLAQHAIAEGQPITVIRPAGIYGPGDLRFLKLFSLVQSRRFVLFGSGETFVHLVYIDDLVEGFIQAMEHPNAIGKTMILAGERYVSLRELVRAVAESMDVKAPRWRIPLWPLWAASALCEWVCQPLRIEPPLHRRRAAFFSKDRAFSIDRARDLIGYHPRTELATGLRRTADWYAANGFLK